MDNYDIRPGKYKLTCHSTGKDDGTMEEGVKVEVTGDSETTAKSVGNLPQSNDESVWYSQAGAQPVCISSPYS